MTTERGFAEVADSAMRSSKDRVEIVLHFEPSHHVGSGHLEEEGVIDRDRRQAGEVEGVFALVDVEALVADLLADDEKAVDRSLRLERDDKARLERSDALETGEGSDPLAQILEGIAAVLPGEELDDRTILGDRIVHAVPNLEALVVAVKAEARGVEALLGQDARFEHFHLAHYVEQDRVDENVIIEHGIEAFRYFEQLAQIEELLFVFLPEGFQFGCLGHFFSRLQSPTG